MDVLSLNGTWRFFSADSDISLQVLFLSISAMKIKSKIFIFNKLDNSLVYLEICFRIDLSRNEINYSIT